MMCQRIGLPPISIMGLGRTDVSSLMRVPMPPARMTAFMRKVLCEFQFLSPVNRPWTDLSSTVIACISFQSPAFPQNRITRLEASFPRRQRDAEAPLQFLVGQARISGPTRRGGVFSRCDSQDAHREIRSLQQ